jgi:hypothetical protein
MLSIYLQVHSSALKAWYNGRVIVECGSMFRFFTVHQAMEHVGGLDAVIDPEYVLSKALQKRGTPVAALFSSGGTKGVAKGLQAACKNPEERMCRCKMCIKHALYVLEIKRVDWPFRTMQDVNLFSELCDRLNRGK